MRDVFAKVMKLRTEIKGNGCPTIFYNGLGRTGSAAIKHGFSETVAHWHGDIHFRHLFHTNIKVLDFITYCGQKHNFIPLVIECMRDPIARRISEYIHYLKKNNIRGNIQEAHRAVRAHGFFEAPECLKWKKNADYKTLLLRYEDITKRKDIFEAIGYNYKPNMKNSSLKTVYAFVYNDLHENLRFKRENLDKIYKHVEPFYTEAEIKTFKSKWEKR